MTCQQSLKHFSGWTLGRVTSQSNIYLKKANNQSQDSYTGKTPGSALSQCGWFPPLNVSTNEGSELSQVMRKQPIGIKIKANASESFEL